MNTPIRYSIDNNKLDQTLIELAKFQIDSNKTSKIL